MGLEDATHDTFPKLLLHHAAQRGHRHAIREKRRGIWHAMTWRELADEAMALAAALSTKGLKRGAHVALISDNRPRLYVAMCAVQWLGAVAIPLNVDAPAPDTAAVLAQLQVSHVFAENQEQVDRVVGLLPGCPKIQHIFYDQDRGMRHYRQVGLISYEALVQHGRTLVPERRQWLQDEVTRGTAKEPAFIFFTAGTSGPAKGLVFSSGALIDRARAAADADRLTHDDVVMAFLSPAWLGQVLVSHALPMLVGYCVCCPESGETMLTDMREIGPTYFLAPPRVLKALQTKVAIQMEDAGRLKRALYLRCMSLAQSADSQALSDKPLPLARRLAYALAGICIYGPLRDVLGMSRIRAGYAAGDAAGSELLMFFRSIGINFKQLYAVTEAGFLVAVQRDGHVAPDTVGNTAAGVEISLSPEGEVLMRSGGMFEKYCIDAPSVSHGVDADGWFQSGDAGTLDTQGQLRITGRMRDKIILNDGTAIMPLPIESRLKCSPFIKEALVLADRHGQLCMLADIDPVAVGNWADRKNISYTGHAELAAQPEVQSLVAEFISKINAGLAQHANLANSQIHRFAILPKELDAADGLLTYLGSVKRKEVFEYYRLMVDALREAHVSARADSSVCHGAVDADRVVTEMRICHAHVFAPMQLPRSMPGAGEVVSIRPVKEAA